MPDCVSSFAPGLTSISAKMRSSTGSLASCCTQAFHLLTRPGGEAVMSVLGRFAHMLVVLGSDGQFEPHAIWIEEIDRVDEVVIGYALHIQTGSKQPLSGRAYFVHRVHLESDVIDP